MFVCIRAWPVWLACTREVHDLSPQSKDTPAYPAHIVGIIPHGSSWYWPEWIYPSYAKATFAQSAINANIFETQASTYVSELTYHARQVGNDIYLPYKFFGLPKISYK